MPKKASCCCPNHGAWGHTDDLILRIVTVSEIKFCGINEDGRHNGRKRQICTSCRDRINLEARCEELQVRLVFLVFIFSPSCAGTQEALCFCSVFAIHSNS